MKLLIGVAIVTGAVVLAKRRALSREGFDIETFLERMPDNAPPKWAYQEHHRDPREHGPDPGAPRESAEGRHGWGSDASSRRRQQLIHLSSRSYRFPVSELRFAYMTCRR